MGSNHSSRQGGNVDVASWRPLQPLNCKRRNTTQRCCRGRADFCAGCRAVNKQTGPNADHQRFRVLCVRGQAGEGWGSLCVGCREAGQTSEEVKEQTLRIGEGRTFRDHKTLEAAAELGVPGRSGIELMWVRGG